VPATAHRRPLELVYYEGCKSEVQPRLREKGLKTGFGRRSRRGLVWSKVIRLRVGQPTTSSLPGNSSHPKELCSVLTRPDTGIGGNFVQRVLIKASKEPVCLS
jgi:hypothetical protein